MVAFQLLLGMLGQKVIVVGRSIELRATSNGKQGILNIVFTEAFLQELIYHWLQALWKQSYLEGAFVLGLIGTYCDLYSSFS